MRDLSIIVVPKDQLNSDRNCSVLARPLTPQTLNKNLKRLNIICFAFYILSRRIDNSA